MFFYFLPNFYTLLILAGFFYLLWRIQRVERSIKIDRISIAAPVKEQKSPVPHPASTEITSPNALGEWLKQDWLLKLGALLLLIGFVWFVQYAFLHNWIGPMGRIALGILAGLLILLLGWWRMKKYALQGSVFLVLGSAIVLLTLLAARHVYDFFTPASALLAMFLSVAFVALSSVQYKIRSLSMVSLVLAGISPLLINAPQTNHIGLFSYLMVVVLGTIWVIALTQWRELIFAALVLVFFYSIPHLFSFFAIDKGPLLLFAYAFAIVFFITNTISLFKLKGEDVAKEMSADLISTAGNGLLLLTWIMVAAPQDWKSLIIAAWMAVFAVGAFYIFTLTKRREPFYVYAMVGVIMLGAATFLELSGAQLTWAYAVETGLIVLLSYWFLRDLPISEKVSALFIIPGILALNSLPDELWRSKMPFEHFSVLLIMAVVLLACGLIFRKIYQQQRVAVSPGVSAMLVAGSFYLYALLWRSLQVLLLNDDLAVMMALVAYTLIGLFFYFYGKTLEQKAARLYGTTILGLVVGRLLLVDIWTMGLTGRIITFSLIGVLLMSTAFISFKKNKSPGTQ